MADISALALLAIFGAALIVSLVTTGLVRAVALRFGFVNTPRADRWSRRRVALLGGLGIVSAFAIVAAGVAWSVAPAALFRGVTPLQAGALLGGGLFVCALGLLDDIRPLRPSTKMIGQIACASLVIGSGLRLSWTGFEVVDVLLSFLWVIGITNSFNLLDNMDGLSAGTGLIASLFYAGLFLASGEPFAALLAILLAGATAGFLVYNFNPASIFMGDSGSLFIGFMLSGLTLAGTGASGADLFAVVVVPTLLLAIPIFDTSLVTIMRKLAGRSIAQGGRDHSSHRLVALGLTERRAVLLLWSLSASGGFVAILATRNDLPIGQLLLPVFLLFLGLLGVYLARVSVYEETEAREAGLAGRITPLLNELLYKRRVIEVAHDLVIAGVAYYASYLLRFEQSPLDLNVTTFTESLPLVVACKMLVLFALGAYRGMWRYTGLTELIVYAKAAAAGAVVSALGLLLLFRFDGYSRSLFVIDAGVFFLLLAGSRLSFRLIDTLIWHQASAGRRTLIYGAGDGGQFALREVQSNETLDYCPVGFLDDDPGKHRRRVHGIPVIGGLDVLETTIAQSGVEVVLVAAKGITTDRFSRLAAICAARGVEVHRLEMRIENVDLVPHVRRAVGS